MGRRGREKQQRQEAAADDVDVDVARNLRGMPWLVWLLFETPSGFAIFSFNSYIFEEENAIELWLKQFQKFEDKSAAINCTTGLGKELRGMLKIWCRRGEKLMVGSLEYKEIIEADQELKGVTCLYNDFVTEVMWGIKNLMHILVPEEQKVLTKEERLPVSKGLEMILHHYHLLKISGLNSSEWDTMKLATALKKITRPGEEIEHPPEMFSSDELLKIEKDADKYKDKIYKTVVSKIWNELVRSYGVKKEKLRHMQFLVEAAAQEAAKREVNQADND
uniref:Nucleolar protein 58/56 N-terminal domain-containing protein n=1 Tax=Oryza barthii TaxID=65489 RepID=A0A0D3H2M8_9ORYZ